ncbi:MAG: diguanylate cyclase, partial [Moritella sp.]|nr:diguanylate cyclase [Moritella sp.]
MKNNVISKKWMYFPIVSMLISTIIGLFIFNLTLSNWIEEKIEIDLSSEITRITNKLETSGMSFDNLEKLDIYIKTDVELSRQNHITLIAFDGTVLADSDISLLEVKKIENHLNRK